MAEQGTKHCSKCKSDLPHRDFAVSKTSADGLQGYCRECFRQYRQERQASFIAEGGEAKERRRGKQLTAAELTELAYATRNLAMRRGAVEDQATGLHGYFTVDEWCQAFNMGPRHWKQVKRWMMMLGIPLAMDELHGHYIGEPGAQASLVISLAKRIHALTQTNTAILEAQQQDKSWPITRQNISAGLASSKLLDIRVLTKMARAAGIDVDAQFERALIAGATAEAI